MPREADKTEVLISPPPADKAAASKPYLAHMHLRPLQAKELARGDSERVESALQAEGGGMVEKVSEAGCTNSAAGLCSKKVEICDGDVAYGKEVEGTKFRAG